MSDSEWPDMVTREGVRLSGEQARSYLARWKLMADAVLLERAVTVLDERFHESITQDKVTAGTAHAWVRYAAQVLRHQAEEDPS